MGRKAGSLGDGGGFALELGGGGGCGEGGGSGEEHVHRIGGGAAEEVSLGLVGAEGAHELELFAGFDSLNDDLHMKVVGHRQNRLDEGAGLRAHGQFADKGAIELEGIEEELGQIAEAGVAGTEVVHGNADAAAGEAADEVGGAFDAGEGGGLGEFKLEQAGAEAGAAEGLLDFFEEGIAGELDAGDVDGDLNGAAGATLPGEAFDAGAIEDVSAELDDEAALFGDGDEAHRGDGSELGVGPAGEGFEANDGVGGEVEFRLVVDANLVVLDGVAEVAFEHEAFASGAAEAVAELDDAIFAVALGGEHGAVGLAEKLSAFFAVIGEEADADAGGHANLVAFDFEGLFEDFKGALGGAVGIGAGEDVVEDEGELVAAEAGEGVGLAEAGLEAAGDLAEEDVACAVTEAVVDELETVEVDVEEGDAAVFALAFGDAVGEAVDEEAAIGEAGEVIDESHVLLAGFGVFAGAIAALEFGEHGVEAFDELADFFAALDGDFGVKRALGGDLEHGAGKIADGEGSFAGFLEGGVLFGDAAAELVDAGEDREEGEDENGEHGAEDGVDGRGPVGGWTDAGQIGGGVGLNLLGRGLALKDGARCGVGERSGVGLEAARCFELGTGFERSSGCGGRGCRCWGRYRRGRGLGWGRRRSQGRGGGS